MKLTTNYGLKKPDASDIVNIDDFNYNADAIDSAIKEVKTKVDSLNLTATNVKMNDGSTVEEVVSANKTSIHLANENISALQEELGTNKSTLKQILIDKKIEGLENENRLSVLIDKVNGLENPDANKLWLYKDGANNYNLKEVARNVTTYGKVAINYEDGYINIINNITTSSNPSSNTAISLGTPEKVDISNYSKIYVELMYTKSGDDTSISLIVSDTYTYTSWQQGFNSSLATYKFNFKNTTDNIVLSLDISSITGKHYISLHSLGSNGVRNSSANVYRIWLEK